MRVAHPIHEEMTQGNMGEYIRDVWARRERDTAEVGDMGRGIGEISAKYGRRYEVKYE